MSSTPTATVHGLAPRRVGLIHLHRDRVRLRGVSVEGTNVGTIVDVMLDPEARKVAGFGVRLAEGDSRFVPLVAVVALGPSGIELDSPLHLMRDIGFYNGAGLPLASLLGRPVGCRHQAATGIADVIAELAAGDVVAVELADGRTLVRESLAQVTDGFRIPCECSERDRGRKLIA
jgi:hypothetical protein